MPIRVHSGSTLHNANSPVHAPGGALMAEAASRGLSARRSNKRQVRAHVYNCMTQGARGARTALPCTHHCPCTNHTPCMLPHAC
jgi:hypothetical protein